MNKHIKRIAIIGPESTGKSTLCEQLSMHYHEPWVPEFARSYLTNLNRKYNLKDIVLIYQKQFIIENELQSQATKYLFTDTEFIIAKIWCNYIFNQIPDSIEKMIMKHPYDFYILTSPDLPWVEDPLREHPGKGEYFFDLYRNELETYKLNYGIVSGKDENRLNMAIKLIDAL